MQPTRKLAILKALATLFPNISIGLPEYNFQHSLARNEQLIEYTSIENGELRKIAEQVVIVNDEPVRAFVGKMKATFEVYVKVLQHNEQIRQRNSEDTGNSNAKVARNIQNSEPSVVFEENLLILRKILEEAAFTVDCKSKLMSFLACHHRQIFKVYPNDPEMKFMVYLLEEERDSPIKNEEDYLTIYEETLQKLLTVINRIKNGKSSLLDICRSVMSENAHKSLEQNANNLVEFVRQENVRYRNRLSRQARNARQMHQTIINSCLKNYYMCFTAKQDIAQIAQRVTQHPELLGEYQMELKSLLDYLTCEPEIVLGKLYNRKLSKRVIRAQEVLNRIEQIRSVQPSLAVDRGSDQKLLKEKIEQIKETIARNSPLNENIFAQIYGNTQEAIILSQSLRKGSNSPFNDTLVALERNLLRDFLLDKEGKRKKVTIKQQMMRESVRQSGNKSVRQSARSQISNRSNGSKMRHPQSTESVEEQLRKASPVGNYLPEIDRFLQQLPISAGDQLQDAANFDVGRLCSLLNSLKEGEEKEKQFRVLVNLLKPEVVGETISELFFPKINLQGFQKLKNILIPYNYKLVKLSSDDSLKNPPSKQFLGLRTKLLRTILANFDKLELILKTIMALPLTKPTHEVSDISTYNMILKLLLAEKEMKVYLLEIEDYVKDERYSRNGLVLLKESVYSPLISTLQSAFSSEQCSLMDLLGIVEFFVDFTDQANRLMDKLIEIGSKQKKKTIADFLKAASAKLVQLRDSGQSKLKTDGKRITTATVERQLVRLEEFNQVCLNGAKAKDIVDPKAKQFLGAIASYV